MVAFVGAGGKTTALFRLAEELGARGARVLMTTTTHLAAAETKRAPCHVHSLGELAAAFQRSNGVLLTGAIEPASGKVRGVPAGEICGAAPLAAHVLVEADGSRGLPFKAPAEHEPVIPVCASLVVPVMGIDAIGQPVAAAHRPERIARIHAGDTVTVEMAAAVLAHPSGGRKSAPAGARIVVLINKVDTEERLRLARRIAALLLEGAPVSAVVIGALREPELALQVLSAASWRGR